MASKEYIGKSDALYIFQLIYAELQKYVVAVQGKGLSEEDFTSTLKAKLDGIAAGAEVNVQSNWNEADSSSDAFILNKPDLSVLAPLASPAFTGTPTAPTPAAGDNTTKISTTAFVTAAITSAISGITGIQFDADTTGLGYVSLLDLQTKHPTGAAGTIYLVQNSGSAPNTKDEYFWNSNSSSYELFGTTAIDLSNYLQTTDVTEVSQAEVLAAWQSVFGV